MNDAIDIAKFIICLAQDNGDLITNLKLQKLLYYAQAWYLVNFNNQKLFQDDIQAWQYGPVVPSVYSEFSKFGRNPIILDDKECDSLDLTDTIKEYLSDFCENFLRFSATELVGMTHNERPWKEAKERGVNSVIDTDLMFNFYSNMLNDEK